MNIQITTLCENTAGKTGLSGEWGLSILVNLPDTTILFDTGGGGSIVQNAAAMGIDLSCVDRIVLSHGHVDHTGGLEKVLMQMNREVEVIAHPDTWGPKCISFPHQPEINVGIPFHRESLEKLGAKFNLSAQPVYIGEHIMTTGEIPMSSSYEEVDSYFYVKQKGGLEPDTFTDDLALVIDADYGPVVILGCAHRGIINTLRQAQSITGKGSVYAAIGGTHLLQASDERIESTIAELIQMGIRRLGASHCTGLKATTRLTQSFEDVFFENNAGTQLEL
ncbi:MAG: MBL fold metallo-hydrolase [Chloroflexota bacterium]|nr:MBL fold metallo-hydrolase [Chloroflexota bacterium]